MPKLKAYTLAICVALVGACSQEPEPTVELSLDTVIDLGSIDQADQLPKLLSTLSPAQRDALGSYLDQADQDKLSPNAPNWYDEPVTYGQAVGLGS